MLVCVFRMCGGIKEGVDIRERPAKTSMYVCTYIYVCVCLVCLSVCMYVCMGRGGLVVKVFDFGGIDVGSNLVRAAWCPWTRHP